MSELQWQQLMDLVDGLTPRVRKAVLTAVHDTHLTPTALARMLAAQPADVVIDELLATLDMATLNSTVQQAFTEIATPEFAALDVAFNVLHPAVLTYLRDADLRRITAITDEVREGIRRFLTHGFIQQQPPPVVARQLRQIIGLTAQQTVAVANYREALTTLDADALQRKLRDARSDAKVKAAIDAAKPLKADYIDSLVARYTQRTLDFRANMIAHTEMMDALHAAQRSAWQTAIDTGKAQQDSLVRHWYVAKDERVCPQCAPIPRLNPKGVAWNELFRTPVGYVIGPTLHPRCRCVVFTRPRL